MSSSRESAAHGRRACPDKRVRGGEGDQQGVRSSEEGGRSKQRMAPGGPKMGFRGYKLKPTLMPSVTHQCQTRFMGEFLVKKVGAPQILKGRGQKSLPNRHEEEHPVGKCDSGRTLN